MASERERLAAEDLGLLAPAGRIVEQVEVELRRAHDWHLVQHLHPVEHAGIVRLEEMDCAATLHGPEVQGTAEALQVTREVSVDVGGSNERCHQGRAAVKGQGGRLSMRGGVPGQLAGDLQGIPNEGEGVPLVDVEAVVLGPEIQELPAWSG